MKNRIARLLVVAFVIWAPTVVVAHPTSAAASADRTGSAEAPPAIAARYALTSRDRVHGSARRSVWHLLRSDSRIETFTLGAASHEVWERDRAGDVTLKRVFDADRRLVEYTDSDLRASQRSRSWAAIASVIDPQLLPTLRRAGRRATEFGSAQVYRRATGDGTLEVWWLPARQLPARVLRSHQSEQLDLRLLELRAQPAGHWHVPPAGSRDDYLAIDSIDLGDMFYDPFVRKVEWIDAQARPFAIVAPAHQH